jgi:nucleotide-binding universal stress UspA family protein
MKIERILVGVDDSEGSRNALRWAADLAEKLGAKIVVAHVFEPLAHLGELAPGSDLGGLRAQAARTLETVLCAPLVQRGIPHQVELVEGNPASALADLAESTDADLIVVASRRRGGFKGLVLGSTSSRLAELSRRPITLVHPQGS